MNLHIINGDATNYPFQSSGIPGDVIVWREILSEGPVKDTNNEELFQIRAKFISASFNESPEEYKHKVIEEFQKLSAISKYDEVFLWFEHDLICQINLLFILKSFLAIDHKKISVVMFYEDEVRQKIYKGFGALSPAQLKQLSAHTISINQQSLQFALDCWSAYSGDDPFKIQQMLHYIPADFPFLKRALRAHLQKFPSTFNGLNFLQQKLIELIARSKMRVSELITDFLSRDFTYGVTDLVVMNMLAELNPEIIIIKDYVNLTKVGVGILNGDEDLLNIKKSNGWIGGFHMHKNFPDIRWNEKSNLLEL